MPANINARSKQLFQDTANLAEGFRQLNYKHLFSQRNKRKTPNFILF